jgi:outer membrane protein assembly factor BamB
MLHTRIIQWIHCHVALGLVASFGAADWRQFRGTDNTAVAADENLPLVWSDAENMAWKADLPGRGPSSPIVVSGRVIVTCSSGAKQDRLHVLCFDAQSGRQRWHRQFWATGRTLCHPESAIAAPTPASDGTQVYAFYSSNDLVCLDLDGNLQWFRGLAHDYPKAGNDTGMSSSPLVVGDTVIVQIESQGDSFAAGLDRQSGENRWRIERPRRSSWASPCRLAGSAGTAPALLLQSPTALTAHDPDTGSELWRYEGVCADIASPVSVAGMVYVPSQGITALRAPDGTPGSKLETVWQQNRLNTSGASPLVYQGMIYTLNSSGVLNCADAATGMVQWQLRLEGRFWATPVAVGNHLYLVNSDGLAQIVRLGGKAEVAGKNDFGEIIQGTPAVADSAFYVRSDRHLWKISTD